ncbi:MAG: HAMP domain-containing protein, partial [Lachnospiraceae bacterium]|nr:HAMP domain-containing protein [Lachnospiraceae bacterium]
RSEFMDKKARRISLGTKIAAAVIFTALLIGLIVGSFSIMKTKQDMMELSINHTRDVAQMAASFVDPVLFEQLGEGDEESEAYLSIRDDLRSFLVENSDIAFIYTMAKWDDKLVFVVDADPEDPADLGEPYESYEVIEEAFSGKAVVDEEVTTDEWGSVYSGYAPIFDKEGSVVGIVGVDCSVGTINARVSSMLRTVVIIELVCFVLALGIAFLLGRVMIKNVLLISERMGQMALSGGDLTQSIELKSNDEIGDTADNFNQFLQKLHDIMSTIKTTEEQLLTFSRETDEKIISAGNDLMTISGTLEDMTDGMEKTSESARMVKNAAVDAGDLSRTLLETSRESADSAAESGKRAVKAREKCVEDLRKVEKIVEEISVRMEEQITNSQRIHEIEKLTGEIVGISDQTQLLALNASIEAARAGESGRGFAVVAEEIGNLADATTKTAKEISQINQITVSTVSELVETSQKMMNYIREEIYNDYREMEKTGNAYYEDADEYARQMKELHGLAEKLSEDIEQVERSLSDITAMTESESGEIADISRGADDISVKMKSVRADTEVNETIIRKLDELIDQFKI